MTFIFFEKSKIYSCSFEGPTTKGSDAFKSDKYRREVNEIKKVCYPYRRFFFPDFDLYPIYEGEPTYDGEIIEEVHRVELKFRKGGSKARRKIKALAKKLEKVGYV